MEFSTTFHNSVTDLEISGNNLLPLPAIRSRGFDSLVQLFVSPHCPNCLSLDISIIVDLAFCLWISFLQELLTTVQYLGGGIYFSTTRTDGPHSKPPKKLSKMHFYCAQFQSIHLYS